MGKVFIVGIGPGNEENRTIRADRALEACDVIAGYPVYVDLVKDRYRQGVGLHADDAGGQALPDGARPREERENRGARLLR